ncbi:hypothetical protein ACFQZC_00600 [Streptacidiphilus monticola]
MKRTVAFVAAGCLGLAALAGCDSGAKVTNSLTAPATPSESATAPAPESSPPATAEQPTSPTAVTTRPATVGDTLTIKGQIAGNKITVTLLKVTDPVTANNDFESPDPGKHWVGLKFRVTNSGTNVYDDSRRTTSRATPRPTSSSRTPLSVASTRSAARP